MDLKEKEILIEDDDNKNNLFSNECVNFFNSCLKKEVEKRIGYRSGIKELKEHKWFNNFDWGKLFNKEIKANFIPKDEKNFDISNEIEKGIKFIKECLTNNKNILIHCKYGISRNTTCAIAFMIKEMNYSALNALEFIRNKRKIAMPNSSFLKQLINYEKQIKNNNNNNEENKSI
jgi:hypothetical protein